MVAELRAIHRAEARRGRARGPGGLRGRPMGGADTPRSRETLAPALGPGGAVLRRALAVRRIVYATNAIEALNSKLRRAVRARGHFPSDEAATKWLNLVLNRAAEDWKRPPREWLIAKTQFAIVAGRPLQGLLNVTGLAHRIPDSPAAAGHPRARAPPGRRDRSARRARAPPAAAPRRSTSASRRAQPDRRAGRRPGAPRPARAHRRRRPGPAPRQRVEVVAIHPVDMRERGGERGEEPHPRRAPRLVREARAGAEQPVVGLGVVAARHQHDQAGAAEGRPTERHDAPPKRGFALPQGAAGRDGAPAAGGDRGRAPVIPRPPPRPRPAARAGRRERGRRSRGRAASTRPGPSPTRRPRMGGWTEAAAEPTVAGVGPAHTPFPVGTPPHGTDPRPWRPLPGPP